MSDNEKGITESGIEKQIVSLEYYISEVKKSLDEISDQMSALPGVFQCDSMEALTSSYNSNKSNYDTLYSQLTRNCEELRTVIANYQAKDQQLAGEINAIS